MSFHHHIQAILIGVMLFINTSVWAEDVSIIEFKDEAVAPLKEAIEEAMDKNLKLFKEAQAEQVFMPSPGGDDFSIEMSKNLTLAEAYIEQFLHSIQATAFEENLYGRTEKQIAQALGIKGLGDTTEKNYVLMDSKLTAQGVAQVPEKAEYTYQPYAMFQASSLLDPTEYKTEEQAMIAKLVANVLVDPVSNDELGTLQEEIDNKKGKGETSADYPRLPTIALFNILEQQAAYSVSTDALMKLYADRLKPAEDKPSLVATMDAEAKRRFASEDGQWYEKVSQASEEALTREIAHMIAFSIFQGNEIHGQNEKTIALLASINATQVKTVAAIRELMVMLATQRKR